MKITVLQHQFLETSPHFPLTMACRQGCKVWHLNLFNCPLLIGLQTSRASKENLEEEQKNIQTPCRQWPQDYRDWLASLLSLWSSGRRPIDARYHYRVLRSYLQQTYTQMSDWGILVCPWEKKKIVGASLFLLIRARSLWPAAGTSSPVHVIWRPGLEIHDYSQLCLANLLLHICYKVNWTFPF